MEKKYEDDELDQLINEQFINEAQIMEEALFSDDDTEDYEASDEEIKASYQQLVDRLKAEGVYREDGKDRGDADGDDCGDANRNGREKCNANDDDCSEEDNCNDSRDGSVGKRNMPVTGHIGNKQGRRIIDAPVTDGADIAVTSIVNKKSASGTESTANISDETDKVIPMSGKKKNVYFQKIGKVAGIIVVSGLCVFAASMTSEANRNYFVKNIKYLTGDRTKIVVDNDEKNDEANTDEYSARKDIEESLDIEVPGFFYRPDSLMFCSYEIAANVQTARIEYIYNNEYIIELHMDKTDKKSTSKFDSLSGDVIDKVYIQRDDIDATITKVQGKEDYLPSYVAQWKKDDVVYCISGKMELDELKEMLYNMKI